MAGAGFYSLQKAVEIQARNIQMRRDFASRDRTLDNIRSGLLQSGNVARDYLMEPGQNATEPLRAELTSIHNDMEVALLDYSRSLRPDEMLPFQELSAEVRSYWTTLNPIFTWDPSVKRDQSREYLRHELIPRRTTVLTMTRDIGILNEQALKEEEQRTDDVFLQFRQRVQFITVFGLFLGLLLAALTVFHTLRLEKIADRRYKESLHTQKELKNLSARLVDAQESERRAISMELHDEIGQSLGALLMDIDYLATIPIHDASLRDRLEKMKTLGGNAVNAIRNMSLLLRPSMLDDLGLVAALEWQAREARKRAGLAVDFTEENVSDALPEEHKTCVYRLVQEALNNCLKHAAATRLRIVLRQEPNRLVLHVQDDGRGFDSKRIRGVGLLGMSERVHHLSGTFEIESEEGRGTRLRVTLPLAGRAA